MYTPDKPLFFFLFFFLQEKLYEDLQFEPGAGIKMARVLGFLAYICVSNISLQQQIVEDYCCARVIVAISESELYFNIIYTYLHHTRK